MNEIRFLTFRIPSEIVVKLESESPYGIKSKMAEPFVELLLRLLQSPQREKFIGQILSGGITSSALLALLCQMEKQHDMP